MNKRFAWLIVIAFLVGGGIYAYNQYSRTRKDSKSMEAKFTVSAPAFIKEFIENEELAKKKYAGNELIISVNGTVKEINQQEKGRYSIVLGDTVSESSVICWLDTLYQAEIKTININDKISLKGRFNGFKSDDLGIGSDVELNFCVLERK